MIIHSFVRRSLRPRIGFEEITTFELECDECLKRFKRKHVNSEFHFCSYVCKNLSQRKGHVLRLKTECSNVKKYGTLVPAQSSVVKNKMKETCLTRYGVEYTSQIASSREKAKNTCLKKYGVAHQSQTSEFWEKFRNTSLERYGFSHPNKSSVIRLKISESNLKEECKNKRKQTCISTFGVENPMLSKEVLSKRELSSFRKWGVSNPVRSLLVRQKIKETFLRRFGEKNPMHVLQFKEKRLRTMKERNSFLRSRPEDEMFLHLQRLFGKVERQKIVNRWPIDFYIESIDSYVQFDGIYWHGLDRPLEEIKQFKNKQDRKIYEKWLTDREQERWFVEHHLQLIRLSDDDLVKIRKI